MAEFCLGGIGLDSGTGQAASFIVLPQVDGRVFIGYAEEGGEDTVVVHISAEIQVFVGCIGKESVRIHGLAADDRFEKQGVFP